MRWRTEGGREEGEDRRRKGGGRRGQREEREERGEGRERRGNRGGGREKGGWEDIKIAGLIPRSKPRVLYPGNNRRPNIVKTNAAFATRTI